MAVEADNRALMDLEQQPNPEKQVPFQQEEQQHLKTCDHRVKQPAEQEHLQRAETAVSKQPAAVIMAVVEVEVAVITVVAAEAAVAAVAVTVLLPAAA